MVDVQFVKSHNLEDVYLKKYIFFRHLKLKIALAIPALNDEKIQLKRIRQDKG